MILYFKLIYNYKNDIFNKFDPKSVRQVRLEFSDYKLHIEDSHSFSISRSRVNL